MGFANSVNVLSHPLSRRLARGLLMAGIAVGLAALTLGSPPAAADDADEVAPAESADSGAEPSRREQRREERRQREAEAAAAELAALQAEADAATAEDGRQRFVVAVEPELECETVAVTGSRLPKRVCRAVGQDALDEQEAQDLLRRTQERSTRIPQEDSFIRSGMPGFQ